MPITNITAFIRLTFPDSSGKPIHQKGGWGLSQWTVLLRQLTHYKNIKKLQRILL